MNLISEGSVTFDADGVFYNPKMKLNRDVCVAMGRALGISDYLDCLAASGLRGLRMALEAGVEKVTFNDVSNIAYRRILENAERNGLGECEVFCSNANALMHERRFEAVDLDPFGTPSPYLLAGARSASSYLFVTATDTAPLCGAHLKSGIRKYMAVPVKTYYHREMGARVLLGLAAREMARLDRAMEPLLTHVTAHYVRVYLGVHRGAKLADRSLEKMGYVEHCHQCGWWKSRHDSVGWGLCPSCGRSTSLAGPLWLGPIHNGSVVDAALRELGEESEVAKRLLHLCRDEIEAPMYYDHHWICRKLGVAPRKVDDLIADLRDAGFMASRTHFAGVAVKTDATMEVLEDIIRG